MTHPDCDRKHPFPTWRAASEVARRTPKAQSAASRLRPFRCPQCGAFHIGRQVTRKGAVRG